MNGWPVSGTVHFMLGDCFWVRPAAKSPGEVRAIVIIRPVPLMASCKFQAPSVRLTQIKPSMVTTMLLRVLRRPD